MNDISKKIGQLSTDMIESFQQGICRSVNQHEQDALDSKQEELNIERQNNIATTAVTMLDAGLNDDKIIEMLQKHWDLRRSEAVEYIKWAHKHMPDKEC